MQISDVGTILNGYS